MPTPRTLGQMVDAGEPLCELFELVRQLAEARGWLPIGWRRIELSGGLIVIVNGTSQEQPDEIGVPVPPYYVTVIRNGWPLGTFGMFGGVLMPGVEDAVIAALEEALSHE